MKKKLFAVIAIALFAMTFSFAKKAKEPKATSAKYFNYETTDDGKGIRITSFKDSVDYFSKGIIIPETIDKKPVTEIAGSRFFSYDNYKSKRASDTCPPITIPASVTTIGDNEFTQFDLRRGVGGLINYGEFIFKDFSKIKVFGDYAFWYAEGFKEKITITSDMSIGDAAFSKSGVTEVVFEGNPKSLGRGAFYECENLKSVTFLADVDIPKDTFANCTSLTDVKVGEDVMIKSHVTTSKNGRIESSESFVGCPLSVASKFALKHAGLQEFASVQELPESPRTEPNPASDFDYTLDADGKGIKITSFKADSGYAFIPDTIDGKPVTTIGSNAFKGAYKGNWDDLYIIKNGIKRNRFRELLSVTIPATVTAIEDSAFSNFTGNLEFKDFKNLKNIGDNAFNGCRELNEKVVITEGMIIGKRAFCGTGISEVDFKASTELHGWTFSFCNNLTNVNIGDGVKVTTTGFPFSDFPESISEASKLALKNVGYYDIIIPSGTTSIYRNYNNFSDGSKDFEITDLMCLEANLIKIPASVTAIGDSAFSDLNGTLEFENFANIKKIGEKAFYHCKEFNEKVVIKEGMVIGKNAFCGTKISEVDFEASTELHGETFSSCNNLTNVNIGDGVKVTTTDFSFSDFPENISDASKLAVQNAGYYDINIPDGTTSIIYTNGYYYDSGDFKITDSMHKKANSIKIPASVTTIGDSVFSDYNGRLEFENFANIKEIGSEAFSNCKSLSGKITLSDGVSIGSFAFSGSGIAEVVFEGTPVLLGREVFANCDNLKSVTFLSSVKFSDATFKNCSSLTDVNIAEKVNVETYKESFLGCPLTFSSMFALKKAGADGFADALDPSAVSSSEKDFKYEPAHDAVNELIITEYIGEAANVIIPDTIEGYPVTEISGTAFKGKQLASVTIPASIIKLGVYNESNYENGLFKDSRAEIIFNNFQKIRKIGTSTFYNFTGKITLADGTPLTAEILSNSNVESFGSGCFNGCKILTGKLTLTDKVKSIGDSAFSGSGITEVVFDGYDGFTTYYDGYRFSNCASLESVLIKKITYLHDRDFSNCESLKKVEFADGVHLYFLDNGSKDYATFKSCKSLTDVVIGESVELKEYQSYSLEEQFYDCPNLNLKSKMAIHNLDEKFHNIYY